MTKKICIVASNFYPEITKKLINGAKNKLRQNNLPNIKTILVSGTFEIPVTISNLINKFDAFVVLGCVIKGKTPHFHYLSSSVFKAIIDISVKSKVPIGNGILICNNKKQAITRSNPNKIDKGGKSAIAVISVLKAIK
mgnify:CR=1 FL=1